MAGKGIKIKIQGDTSDLEKKLSQIGKTAQAAAQNIEGKFKKAGNTISKTMEKTADESQKAQEKTAQAAEECAEKIEKANEKIVDQGEKVEEAYDGLKEGAEQAETAVDGLGTAADEAGDKGEKAAQRAKVGLADLKAGLDMVLAVGKKAAETIEESIQTYTGFDDAMRQVQATMNATAEETERLTAAAREAGASTRYTAAQAAEALNYLALAGYNADEAIESLPVVLQLAQAGGIDLAYASDLLTDSMAALGKGIEDMTGFADQMAVTSQKSNTNVAQLGEAILTVGGTAKQLKGDTVELNTALGILADNGIKGSEGGTALRNMLLSLTAPTDSAAAQLKALGVSVYDAQGNMRGLNEIFADLSAGMKGFSDEQRNAALSEIFNNRDLKSAEAMLANYGERWNELSGYIAEAEGATAQMADTMEGGLGGSIRSLQSALEAVEISAGDSLSGVAKEAIDEITGILREAAEGANVEEILTKLINGASSALPGAVEKLAAALPGLVRSGLGNVMPNLVQNVFEAVGTLAGNVVAMLPELIPELLMGTADLFVSNLKGIDKLFDGIAEGAHKALVKLGADVPHIGESMDALIESVEQTEIDEIVLKADVDFTASTSETQIQESVAGIYESISTALTDGLPDTDEVVSGLQDDVEGLATECHAKINEWFDAQIEELNASGKTGAEYREAYADIIRQAKGLHTAVNQNVEDTNTFIENMAGKSTAYVQEHLGELQALADTAEQIAAQIDSLSVEQRNHGEVSRTLTVTGATQDQSTQLEAIAFTYQEYAEMLRTAEEEYAAAIEEARNNGLTGDEYKASEADAKGALEAAKQQAADYYQNYMQQILAGIAEADPELAGKIDEIISQQNMADMMRQLSNRLLEEFDKFQKGGELNVSVADLLGELNISEADIAAWAQELEITPDFLMRQMEAALKTGDTAFGGEATEIFSSVADGLEKALAGGELDLSAATPVLAAAIQEGYLIPGINGVDYTAGGDLFNELLKGAIRVDESASSEAKSAAQEAGIQAAEAADVSDEMQQAGSNAGQGLINGLKPKLAQAVATVRSAAQSIVSTIKTILKINSPSRVMAELGEFTGEGFDEGLRSAMIEAVHTAKALSGEIVTAADFTNTMRVNIPDLNQEIRIANEQSATPIHLDGVQIAELQGHNNSVQLAWQNTRKAKGVGSR